MRSDSIPLNPSERRDAAANRARILRVAEALFEQNGVDAVNMAEIAQEAGVGKGTLYRNFGNKGELCLALMDTQLREFQDERLEAMRSQAEAGVPYVEQLARFLEALVAFSARHLPLLCEVQQIAAALDAGEAQRPHFWQYMTVHGLLRSAVQTGELPPDFDAAYGAEALLAPLAPHTFRFQQQVLGFDLSRVAAGMRMILDGLRSLTRIKSQS
jgi:AcrR family transcriptional regulator